MLLRVRLGRGESLAEHLLRLVGALAALALGPAEEVGQLTVAVPLGILDVGVQPQHVVHARLGEPDDVVVLVLRTGHVAGLGGRHRVASLRVSPLTPTRPRRGYASAAGARRSMMPASRAASRG